MPRADDDNDTLTVSRRRVERLGEVLAYLSVGEFAEEPSRSPRSRTNSA